MEIDLRKFEKAERFSIYYRSIWRVLVTIYKNRDVEMSLHRVRYNRHRKVDES